MSFLQNLLCCDDIIQSPDSVKVKRQNCTKLELTLKTINPSGTLGQHHFFLDLFTYIFPFLNPGHDPAAVIAAASLVPDPGNADALALGIAMGATRPHWPGQSQNWQQQFPFLSLHYLVLQNISGLIGVQLLLREGTLCLGKIVVLFLPKGFNV